MDKSWLLKREALQLAKQCIDTLQREMGVRLKLADPDFLGLLEDYVDLVEDPSFKDAVISLYQQADITPNFLQAQAKAEESSGDWVEYLGGSYPRFKDNKEFKSLYRGQPVYA